MNVQFKPALTHTRRILFGSLSSGQHFTYNGKSYIKGLMSFGSKTIHVAVNEKNHEDVAFLFGEIVEIEEEVLQELSTLDDGDYFFHDGMIWILTLMHKYGETEMLCYSIDKTQMMSEFYGNLKVVKLEIVKE